MPQPALPDSAATDESIAVVIGGSNVDYKSQTLGAPVWGTSNPGRSRASAGGVGRNVAENLARLGITTELITAIGRDADGDWLARETLVTGVDLRYSVRTSAPTGTYTAVLDNVGDMIIAVAAMEATDELTAGVIDRCAAEIARAGVLVLDCNVPEATLIRAAAIAHANAVPIVVDPVSTVKASRVRALLSAGVRIHTLTPNRDELGALVATTISTDRDVASATAQLHDAGIDNVWVSLGGAGSYLSSMTRTEGAEGVPVYPSTLVDVTGAGDAMLAGYVAGLLRGQDPFLAARYGSAAASITIESDRTVSPSMDFAALASRVRAL